MTQVARVHLTRDAHSHTFAREAAQLHGFAAITRDFRGRVSRAIRPLIRIPTREVALNPPGCARRESAGEESATQSATRNYATRAARNNASAHGGAYFKLAPRGCTTPRDVGGRCVPIVNTGWPREKRRAGDGAGATPLARLLPANCRRQRLLLLVGRPQARWKLLPCARSAARASDACETFFVIARHRRRLRERRAERNLSRDDDAMCIVRTRSLVKRKRSFLRRTSRWTRSRWTRSTREKRPRFFSGTVTLQRARGDRVSSEDQSPT